MFEFLNVFDFVWYIGWKIVFVVDIIIVRGFELDNDRREVVILLNFRWEGW